MYLDTVGRQEDPVGNCSSNIIYPIMICCKNADWIFSAHSNLTVRLIKLVFQKFMLLSYYYNDGKVFNASL